MEKKITATTNLNLLDISIIEQGGLSALFDNALANGISITDDLGLTGIKIIVVENKRPEVIKVDQSIIKESVYLKPLDKQNLWDMALVGSGSISAVFDYAQLNRMSVTDDIFGQEIKAGEVLDFDVYNFYKFQTIRPASGGTTNKDFIPVKPEGVDYWAILYDFIVN
ncbi:MAG: hypothetical protein IE931_03305 [Sphingobacteriales bacterium]|nr:hypothetical protein [Sphingobacteriales bacterium]